jgi:acyl carrier protein
MGIDLLDIAYRVERAFGVQFDVKDFFEERTKEPPDVVFHSRVGDLYDLILEKRKALGLSKGKIRPEAFATRDVRLALAEVLYVSPEDFRPQDKLSRLLPLEDRRKLWRRLRKRLKGLGPLKARERRFEHARWVALFVAAVGGALGLSYVEWHIGWPILYLATLLGGAFALNTVGDAWSANLVPKEVHTVELLAKTHLARNRRHYIDECGGTDSDEDVWHTLQVILVDVLGVEIGKITKEADLVRDLGAE